ncbi:tRNA(Met) cytidine acetyltransferase TmcA [Chromohalobacter israelensis]|uniref:tRNA(Met) cytidine acetyltransferase TmcA n=1 Tax=Chromohalobacter israelensis TaxID=141390 RepID=UPI0015C488A4|nr:GNAT family N-acetyltransferase [Chromohalobacter salexigens]NWO56490.1 GNAT family N-acetyltransferase [Chromohalobacter salexigens]
MRVPRDDAAASMTWLATLVEACQAQDHRGVVWVAAPGEQALARACAIHRSREWHAPLWVGEGEPGADMPAIDRLPMSQARSRLGQEHDLLIFDARTPGSGFDPDAFGALSGTVRAGGLLVVLTPAEWTTGTAHPDNDYARLAHWPHDAHSLSVHYLTRLARVLHRDAGVWYWPAERRMPRPGRLPSSEASPPRPDDTACVTADQAAAVHRLTRLRRRRPVVLSADRGRGKSAALGIAAARRLQAGETLLWVTAPRRASVEPLFARLAALFPHGHRAEGRFQVTLASRACEVRFLAPDAVIEALSAPDVDRRAPPTLFVDEAAAIPTPLLARWLEAFPRLAFATTVHGYEGTGRGFQIRFYARLSRDTPDWREVRLAAPVRWAEGDPLERLTRDMLLLDAAPADDAEATAALAASPVHIRWLDRAALAEDESMLAALFGLLVQAHYRTTPGDLRQLLDGPDVRLAVAYAGTTCLGVCQVQAEGGFPEDLAERVVLGERRPRGHLLAQSLAAHGGWQAALTSRWWRIMRIAVHPAARRRGIGRALVEAVAEAAPAAGIDRLGVSFGAEASLIAFWHRQGFVSLRLGLTRDAASGEHALMMGRSPAGAGDGSLETWAHALQDALPGLLAFELNALEGEVATALLREGPVPVVSAALAARLAHYARGAGELSLARPWLCEAWLVWWRARPAVDDETPCEETRALREWASVLFQGRDAETTPSRGRQARLAHWRHMAAALHRRLTATA